MTNPGDGYRLLEGHEIIREGDELRAIDPVFRVFLAEGGKDPDAWRPATMNFGQALPKSALDCVRRPIRLDPSNSCYRLLDEGETLKEGDEYFNEGASVVWWPIYPDTVGMQSVIGHPFKHRRRIDVSLRNHHYCDPDICGFTCTFCGQEALSCAPDIVSNSHSLGTHKACLEKTTRIQRVLVGWEVDHYKEYRHACATLYDEKEPTAAVAAREALTSLHFREILGQEETARILAKKPIEVGIDDMSGDDL